MFFNKTVLAIVQVFMDYKSLQVSPEGSIKCQWSADVSTPVNCVLYTKHMCPNACDHLETKSEHERMYDAKCKTNHKEYTRSWDWSQNWWWCYCLTSNTENVNIHNVRLRESLILRTFNIQWLEQIKQHLGLNMLK